MMINQIGGFDPLKNVQTTQKASNKTPVTVKEDTVSVSSEAKQLAEAYYMQEVADSVPDTRADLVARIKDKIKDPSYINQAVISSTADRFLDSLGL